MSIKSNDVNLSDISFEFDSDSSKNSEESSKTRLIEAAKTLEPSYNDMSEKKTNLSSKDPPLEEVNMEIVPPTIVTHSTTKTTTNDVKVTTKNSTKDVPKITKKVKPSSTKPKTSAKTSKNTRGPMSTPPPASKRAAEVTKEFHFADLAYDISSVIGFRDTAGDDDHLTLSGLKHENTIRRKRQARKLIKLASTRENRILDFEDKLYLVKVNKVVNTVRRDMTDRKKFVDSSFTGQSSLTLFIDDWRTETMARQGRKKLVSIQNNNGMTMQLIGRFNSISEEEMKKEKSSCTPEQYNMSKNM